MPGTALSPSCILPPFNPCKSPMSQGLILCQFHRLVNWGTEQPSLKRYNEPGVKLLPQLQSPGSSSLRHAASQKNGIWRKLPVLLLSSRKMKTSSLVPAHSWLQRYFIGNLSSRVCLLLNYFPAGKNASSICAAGFATGNSCLHPNTCHSLDTEFSGAVVGSGGL